METIKAGTKSDLNFIVSYRTLISSTSNIRAA